VNYTTVPGVVYTHLKLARHVGLTEADAKRDGKEVRVGKVPMLRQRQGQVVDDIEGMVKIVGAEKTTVVACKFSRTIPPDMIRRDAFVRLVEMG